MQPRLLSAASALVATLALLSAPAADARRSESAPSVVVPTPTIVGPIPAAGAPGSDMTRSYPQLASEPVSEITRRGYVEEEFFFGGTATRYQTPALANGIEISAGHGYQSRLIVRRPVEREKFNGVVLVEWVNVTSGYGIDLHWHYSREYLMREGYAHVAVQAQRVGIHQAPFGLRNWSPARYGSLDLTANGTINDDSLSYDVFSQVAQALRGPGRWQLMGDLRRPETIIAVGQSQSASRLTNYYNSIQPLHRVYDGFLLQVAAGTTTFRTDVGTKLIRVNSENEIVRGQAAGRQPDSQSFRSWEIAGASHVDYFWAMYRHSLAARDGIATPNYTCTPEALSHVPLRYVLNAGYHHLVRWIEQGKPPPAAQPIIVTSLSPLEIPRDADGLVFGGIRQPAVEVPTATNSGANRASNSPCNLYGSHEPFSAAKLAQRYPTHQSYYEAVKDVVRQNMRDGFLLKEDAEEVLDEARYSPVGSGRPLPIP